MKMRKLFTVWIVLAAIVAPVAAASAQMSPIPGFPPGTFQNRAALDAGGGGGPTTIYTDAINAARRVAQAAEPDQQLKASSYRFPSSHHRKAQRPIAAISRVVIA